MERIAERLLSGVSQRIPANRNRAGQGPRTPAVAENRQFLLLL